MRKKTFYKKIIALSLSVAVASSLNIGEYSILAEERVQDEAVISERVGEEGNKEIPGTFTTFKEYDPSFLSVSGFAEGNVNDRSEYIGTEYYRQVSTPEQFVEAVYDANQGKVKVIEILKDLELGGRSLTAEICEKYVDVEDAVIRKDKMNSGFSSTNPLITENSGVTKISIKAADGLTIFSRYGATLKYTQLDLTSASNDIVVRNIAMDGLWQWDNTTNHKEAGFCFIKVNCNNVWIDHCSFTQTPDGEVDLEKGAHGVTVSWCKFGVSVDEALENESIVASINFMEKLYQADVAAIKEGKQTDYRNSDVNGGNRYSTLRNAGITPEEIMKYTAYHKKVHMVGGGSTDVNLNSNIAFSLGYNWYRNVGSRVSTCDQGRAHMYNNYIDDMGHFQLESKFVKEHGVSGGYRLSRCLDTRNTGSIAADTCVFNGIDQPIIYCEVQEDDGNSGKWDPCFDKAYNHALIVNSKVTTTNGKTYSGSSWDNNGENLFTAGVTWRDKATIGSANWVWKTTVTTKVTAGTYVGYFDYFYDKSYVLPYEIQLVSLDDVKDIVTTHSGAGVYDLTDAQWLSVTYSEDADIEPAGENKIWIGKEINFVDEEPVTYVGDTIKLEVITTPLNVTDAKFTWEAVGIQKKKVSVDAETGEITALQTGNVTIKVICKSINGTVVSGSTTLKVLATDQKPAEDVTGPATDVTGGVGDVTGGTGDVTGGGIDISSDGVDISGDGVDISGDGIDISGDGADLSGDGADLSGGSADISGDGADVSGGGTDISGDGTDVSDEGIDVTPGDVTLDGKVDLLDAQKALKEALGIGEALTGIALIAADVDGIEGVDLRDAQIVLKLALGIPVNFSSNDAQTEVAQMILKKKLGLKNRI